MRVLVTGATGFIGQKLGHALTQAGHKVIAPVRDVSKAKTKLSFPCEILQWNGLSTSLSPELLKDVEGVIHLAGEPIAEGRWTENKKAKIRNSRVFGTRTLVDSLLNGAPKLRVFVSSSAVGFYGFHQDEWLSEDSPGGDDFLAGVARDWEREANAAGSGNDVRVVCVRTGLVLGHSGGALPKLLPLFKLGLGGKLGTGQQWMSWIHIDDLVDLFLFALENESVIGPVNAVAPTPVRNTEFTEILASRFGKKSFIGVPKLALQAALGEMSEVLLKGQRASSKTIEERGFKFKFPELAPALSDILGNKDAR